MLKVTSPRYSTTAVILHWISVLLVLVVTGLALFRETFDGQRTGMISAHKVVGLVVLIAACARSSWRMTHRPPAMPATVGRKEAILADIVHRTMYLLLLVVPIAGWIFVSAAPDHRPLDYRGLDNIPKLPVAVNDVVSFFWHEVHEILGFVFIGLVFVHVAGVLRHEVFGSGGIAARMLPGQVWLRAAIVIAVVAWLIGLLLDMTVLERLFAAGDAGEWERFETYLHDDVIVHAPMGLSTVGLVAEQASWRRAKAAMPDLHHEFLMVLHDGTTESARCVVTGTMNGIYSGMAAPDELADPKALGRQFVNPRPNI